MLCTWYTGALVRALSDSSSVHSPVKMSVQKVRYSRTTPISCYKSLHTLLPLRCCGARRGSLCLTYLKLVHKHPAHIASPVTIKRVRPQCTQVHSTWHLCGGLGL